MQRIAAGRGVNSWKLGPTRTFVGLEEKTVRKEVEYGLFGSESPPRFSLPALVYFRVLVLLGLQPSVEERKRIYTLITKAFARAKRPAKVDMSPVLELKLGDVTEEVEYRLARFEAWKKKIVVDSEILGGEPVFAKSRLAIRRVGAMTLRGRANRGARDPRGPSVVEIRGHRVRQAVYVGVPANRSST